MICWVRPPGGMREALRLASISKLLSRSNKTELRRQIKQMPTILLGLEILALRAGRGPRGGGTSGARLAILSHDNSRHWPWVATRAGARLDVFRAHVIFRAREKL